MTKEDWDLPPAGLPDSFLDSLDEDDGPRGDCLFDRLIDCLLGLLIEWLVDWLIDWLSDSFMFFYISVSWADRSLFLSNLKC